MSDKEILKIKMNMHSLDIEINKLQDAIRIKQSAKKLLSLEFKSLRLQKPTKSKKKVISDDEDEDIPIIETKKTKDTTSKK